MIKRGPGRPIVPTSESFTKPWLKLGVSRATYYWRKRYNDLPTRKVRRRVKPEPPSWAAEKVRELTYDF